MKAVLLILVSAVFAIPVFAQYEGIPFTTPDLIYWDMCNAPPIPALLERCGTNARAVKMSQLRGGGFWTKWLCRRHKWESLESSVFSTPRIGTLRCTVGAPTADSAEKLRAEIMRHLDTATSKKYQVDGTIMYYNDKSCKHRVVIHVYRVRGKEFIISRETSYDYDWSYEE